MSTVTTVKALVRHRKLSWLQLATVAGVQDKELATLRPQVTALEAAAARATTLHKGARLLAAGLRLQLDAALDIRDDINAKAVRCDEAEARAITAEQQLAAMTQELTALRQFRANVNAATIPQVGHRDIGPDETATVPVKVVTLAEKFNPARITWDIRNEQAGVAS